MFSEEFYPTPKKVIGKMLEPFLKPDPNSSAFRDYDRTKLLSNKIILEPSAGKGDILDYMTGDYVTTSYDTGERYYGKKNGNIREETTPKIVDRKQIYCCELDPNLKHILYHKRYRVIADDFLSYNGDYFFDLIVMNPPFSNGDEHLMKAWDILHEGDIVCLLNSETLNNTYTERRKLLKHIIEQHGSIEELGPVFSTAERQTDVNVSLVRLHKTAKESKFDFQFENVTKEKSFRIDESTIHDAPAVKDVIGNMLLQYDKVKEAFIEYMKIAEALDFYGEPLIKERSYDNDKTDIFQLAQQCYKDHNIKKEAFNAFCDGMKVNMWDVTLDNLNSIASFNMDKFMTHGVRQNFGEFRAKQGEMDFTRENVWNLITMLFENKESILERAIVEVFDLFTKYHSDNRLHVEGWKTNDKYKVNRKIILPRAIRYGAYCTADDLKRYGDKFDLSYETASEYSDIDKVMDYITGEKRKGLPGLRESIKRRLDDIGKIRTGETFDNKGTSAYFDWKFWKKGTMHIEFKDPELWQEFNMRACAQKKWLPEKEEAEWRRKKQKSASAPIPNQLQLVENL